MSKEKINYSNPLTLPFPKDVGGVCMQLRRGGKRSANAIGTRPENLERYLKTLAVLAEHAKAKFKRNVDYRQAKVQTASNAQERILRANVAAKSAEAEALRKRADELVAGAEAMLPKSEAERDE